MSRAPRPLPSLDVGPRPPLVIHARHETTPREQRHPCGVPYERGVTHEPRVVNFDYATGRALPMQRVNCPGCVAASGGAA